MIFHGGPGPGDGQFIIPATPGFYLLSFVCANKPTTWTSIKGECVKSPIIGWLISSQSRTPVTVDVDRPLVADEVRAILLPTGAVVGFNGERFTDLDSWSLRVHTDWRSRWDQERKAAA